MLLGDTEYLARSGVAFVTPIHLGAPPLIRAAAILTIALCAYTDALADVTLYNNLSTAFRFLVLSTHLFSALSRTRLRLY